MYKATREFIQARQPYANMELKVVTVKQLGGGVPNNCSDNAIDNAENMDDVRSVTGWLGGCQIFCVNGVRLLLRHSFLKLNTKLI